MVTPSVKSWNNIPNDAGFLYGIRDFIPTYRERPCSVVATGDKIYTANYYTSGTGVYSLNGKNLKKQVLGAPLAFTKVGKGDMYLRRYYLFPELAELLLPVIRMTPAWTDLTGTC